ncbi:MAG TPA: GDSL-type esterase/lipase family protein [Kiritimatiellia bacterium]|nr:GDSL-type esterase/lipase family protein [Kiritimatiellia bacterium]
MTKMKWLTGIAMMLACGAVADAECNGTVPPKRMTIVEELFAPHSVILFQGDSITHGGRLRDMNHYLGHGYQAEIAMRYLAYRPDLRLQFGNRGVSGHTSSNLVARWHHDAVPYTPDESGYDGVFPGERNKPRVPDVLSILIGINDYLRKSDGWFVPVADYERNLRFMVTNSLAANPKMKIVLCEPFRLPEDTDPDFLARQATVRRVATDYNLVFVPFQKLFSEELLKEEPRPRYWFWDAFHPTYAAHMRMADFWIATVAREFASGKGNPSLRR